ncbi:MAG: zinc-binding metallopeptidase family protein [Hyphomicrobium sp.]
MRNFACTKCGNTIYFENIQCLKCNHAVGFDARTMTMVAIEPAPQGPGQGPGLFKIVNGRDTSIVRHCSNGAHGVCNWLTLSSDPNTRCVACDLNRTIPNLAEQGSLKAWRDLERAKKRLVYSLLRYHLPLDSGDSSPGRLTFDFARNTNTGHLDGVISIDITEADAVERERLRQYFDEPYRTLLGHLRHESGHFYWSMLIADTSHLAEFRRLFGDETQSYSAAIERHHAQGAPANWQSAYVSAYASSHPWEDWAETWAHYLHMTEAVDTAEAAGMEPRAAGLIFGSIWPFKRYDIYRDETFGVLMDRWIPLTIAMNRLARGMGHNDFYPFVIPAPAFEKLAFVHRVVRERAQQKN